MNALCPRCGAKLAIREAGEVVQCYSCQHEFAAEPLPPPQFPWLKLLRGVLVTLAALLFAGLLWLLAANAEKLGEWAKLITGGAGSLVVVAFILVAMALLLITGILWIFFPLFVYSLLMDIRGELRRLNR